jgi:hypothetical protein
MASREPAKQRKSTMSSVKSRWHKAKSGLSLKEFVRQMESATHNENDAKAAQFATDWLYNKRANTSNPPRGIGRTNGKKGASGKK